MPPCPEEIRRIAIIGTGVAGLAFVLEDVMPANLRRAANALEHTQRSADLITALTVEDAVREADLAIDFVPDELESKLEIFSMVDRMAPPRTILCTPTDTLSITDLASCTYRPDRCFALRSHGLGTAGELRSVVLSYPPAAEAAAARGVLEALLRRLGMCFETLPDAAEPQLIRPMQIDAQLS